MTKEEILKELEKIAIESTDAMAQVEALIFLYNNHVAEEKKAENDKFKEKSKEHFKVLNELLTNSYDLGYGA